MKARNVLTHSNEKQKINEMAVLHHLKNLDLVRRTASGDDHQLINQRFMGFSLSMTQRPDFQAMNGLDNGRKLYSIRHKAPGSHSLSFRSGEPACPEDAPASPKSFVRKPEAEVEIGSERAFTIKSECLTFESSPTYDPASIYFTV